MGEWHEGIIHTLYHVLGFPSLMVDRMVYEGLWFSRVMCPSPLPGVGNVGSAALQGVSRTDSSQSRTT
jgi:hypothetical protein